MKAPDGSPHHFEHTSCRYVHNPHLVDKKHKAIDCGHLMSTNSQQLQTQQHTVNNYIFPCFSFEIPLLPVVTLMPYPAEQSMHHNQNQSCIIWFTYTRPLPIHSHTQSLKHNVIAVLSLHSHVKRMDPSTGNLYIANTKSGYLLVQPTS